jgi:type I restriction enzyme S subunit
MTFNANLAEIVEANENGLLGAHPSWGRVPLKDVASILNGYPFDARLFGSNGVPLLRIRDVLKSATNTKYSGEIPEGYWIRSGDLVVGMDGDFNCARWKGEPALLNQRVCKLSADSRFFHPSFLHRVLGGYLAAINSYTSSITVKHLSSKTIGEIPLPLPPLSEQRRSADKLDDLLARVETSRDRLDRVPGILKRFRQAVLAAATSGELTQDWREAAVKLDAWQTLSIGDIVDDVRYGTSKKCEHAPGQVPVLRIPNVSDGVISHDDLKHAEFDDSELRKLALAPGDILMIRSNGSVDLVGRSAVATYREEGFLYAGYLIRLRANQEIVRPEFLNLSISSPSTRGIIELTARSTTGVNNINAEEIRSLPIALPSLAEQDEIVRRVGILFGLASQVEAQARKGTHEVEALVTAILAKAFRGELVPQDHNDEPASVLLDRIRTERDAAGTAPKKRGRALKVAVGAEI